MLYTNFSSSAAHLLTTIGHSDYLKHEEPSPWNAVPGFHLGSVFFDMMHCIWLGSAKVFFASILGYWERLGLLGAGESLAHRLRDISFEMKRRSKDEGLLARSILRVSGRVGVKRM